MECPYCTRELEWHNIVTRKKDGFLLAEEYTCMVGRAIANGEEEHYELDPEDYCESSEFGGYLYFDGNGELHSGHQPFT